ncbi:MAG TPA: oligopeptide transporter, OPT family [Verrucomicrobiae bacterium]|nr:oligopeptide transporter, OPT family [Verrucomicrobiae bacterium]
MAEQPAAKAEEPKFQPYVSPEENRKEFTFRAIFFGGVFGVLFGAVTVYVGLRAGLTVAASIPIAVLSISILRALGKASILENNIVQTAGSAGESVAGGVIFTLPALIFLGFGLDYWRITLLALIGGCLGVCFMIPLRRQLIVKEHGNLLYPEGTACADVLIAGDKGGSFASRVFAGLGLGALYTLFQNENMFAAWPSTPTNNPGWLPGGSIRANTTTEYLGVGYIIGPRIAGIIFSGGVFAWLVVMPAIKFFGAHLTGNLYPGTKLIADMSPDDLWRQYIRPMGAGAVAAAGLITLMRTLPTIIGALRAGAKDLKAGAAGVLSLKRTDRDIPLQWALVGAGGLLLFMWGMLTFFPIKDAHTTVLENFFAALLVVIFGFLFVTVSSRITGLIGTSSNPISGMAIATLMATCAVFLVLGWTATAFFALAITIGGVVCIASANAGNTSQDLKTGFLVGATPSKQQLALVVGVIISVFVIGATLIGMDNGLAQFRAANIAVDINKLPDGVSVDRNTKFDRTSVKLVADKTTGPARDQSVEGMQLLNALNSPTVPDGQYFYNPKSGKIEVQWIHGIGSDKAAAPQARLMATVINGILTRKLPWGLILLGVFLVVAVELLGVRSLSFAVGFYIPMATTLTIFCGGVVRWLVEKAAKRAGEKSEESDVSPGSLYASGLIAAGGIVGLLGIAFKLVENYIRDHRSDIVADKFRSILSFGSHEVPAGSGDLHYRLADFLGGASHTWVPNVIGVITFILLGYSLFHFARKPLEGGKK